jgi:hypothetical protein
MEGLRLLLASAMSIESTVGRIMGLGNPVAPTQQESQETLDNPGPILQPDEQSKETKTTTKSGRPQRRAGHYGERIEYRLPPDYNTRILEVRPSLIPAAGRGLFLLQDIKEGEVVANYAGRRITEKIRSRAGYDSSYVAASGANMIDALDQVTKGVLSDGGFLNDPFDPSKVNCTFDDDDRDDEAIVLRATRDILAGEELYVSYGGFYWCQDVFSIEIQRQAIAAYKINIHRPGKTGDWTKLRNFKALCADGQTLVAESSDEDGTCRVVRAKSGERSGKVKQAEKGNEEHEDDEGLPSAAVGPTSDTATMPGTGASDITSSTSDVCPPVQQLTKKRMRQLDMGGFMRRTMSRTDEGTTMTTLDVFPSPSRKAQTVQQKQDPPISQCAGSELSWAGDIGSKQLSFTARLTQPPDAITAQPTMKNTTADTKVATGRGTKLPKGTKSSRKVEKSTLGAAARRAQDIEDYLAHQRGRREWDEDTETEQLPAADVATMDGINETAEWRRDSGGAREAGEASYAITTGHPPSTHTERPQAGESTGIFELEERTTSEELVAPARTLVTRNIQPGPQSAQQVTEQSTAEGPGGTIGARVTSTTERSSGRGVKRARVVKPDGAFTMEKRRRSG